jgi:hypothetical protein
VSADTALEPLLERAEQAVLVNDLGTLRALVGQLWPTRRQVPELLTRRLIAGRSRAPLLTLELLSGFAGRQSTAYLRRVAEHDGVPDLVRWSARRYLGWPERGQPRRRLMFLASLRDPDRALVEAAAQASAGWPPDSEMLDEVLAYLIALPSARRQGVAQRIAAQLGAQAAWLLYALLQVDDAATQRVVLAELARLRPPGAAAVAARLAGTARTVGVRTAATTTAQRLRLRLVDSPEPAAAALPPLTKALLSALDGAGNQIAFVVRQWPDGLLLMAEFLCREGWGVKEVIGQCRATADRLAASLTAFHERGVALVEVDLAAVRGMLLDAVAVSAASGRRLPPAFELWEPILHDAYPPPDDAPTVRPQLDAMAYRERDDLLRASGRLADHPFCASWGFPPQALMVAMFEVPTTAGRPGERHYQAALARLLDAPTRERLRQRLQRQAWLLDRAGDTDARDLALAVAARLDEAPVEELARLPLLQRLLTRGLVPPVGALRFGA